jgi:predicted nucleic acid-binding protein
MLDEIFIHLAVAAGADYLVTGDDDLLGLRVVAPARVTSVEALHAVAAPPAG